MKKLFECSYCKCIMSNELNMNEHEKQCAHNPNTKSCNTCKNFINSDKHEEYKMYCIQWDGRDKTETRLQNTKSNCENWK